MIKSGWVVLLAAFVCAGLAGPASAQLEDNLGALDPAEFSGVLRPVFQKDEWKLILAGGVIGTAIGALQVVVLFGGFS